MRRISADLLPSFFFPTLALGALGALALGGCDAPAPEAAIPQPASLVEQWSDVRVVNPVPVPGALERWEITFGEDAEDVEWNAVQGIEDLRVENGALVGRTTSTEPLLLLELPEPAGGGDELWSVEATLRASAGNRMGVHPVPEPGPPMEVNVARVNEFPISSPIVASDAMKTIDVKLDHVFLFEMMPATREPRKILFRPTNAADADFALESLRLVFRQEYLSSIDSGPGWHGLGEVFRETLVSRTPETLIFDVDLPQRPWLGLAVGSVEETPPAFRVEVAAKDAEPQTVAEIRPEEPETWRLERVDLSDWAGEPVEIRLAADADEEGVLAFWGAPTVRGSLPEDAERAELERPQTVILFLADTLRSDHLDAWGHGRETAPTISRLASEGVRFADAIAQSTWTKVSVSSILTSLYPSTSGVAGLSDRISAAETTLAESFREAGYATFSTSSVPFSGQLTNLHQGVEVLYEFGAIPRGEGDYRSKTSRFWIDTFLPWLEVHRDVPVFAFVHVMDPHSPFEPEAPYDTLFSTEEEAERWREQADRVRPHIDSPLWQRFDAPTAEDLEEAGVDAESFVRHEKNWYDASIRSMDVEIERMMAQLREMGLADDVLLAFVSDHGEEFLEHGKHWHGTSVYGEVTNVPMALWGRGVPAGRVVERTVETIDLYPTLLELAGLEVPERAQGESLVPLFATQGGTDAGRERPAFSELPSNRPDRYPRHAMVDGKWKLIWNREAPDDVPEYELYDHRADPLNQEDVVSEHPEVVERLAEQLRRFRSWATEQKVDESAAQSQMSAEELEQLRSLGYID